MKAIIISALLTVFIVCFPSAYGVQGASPDSVAVDLSAAALLNNTGIDLFGSEEPLEMTLRFNIREFLRQKDQPEYQDALLTMKVNGTDTVSQKIKVKARGGMRCAYCSFPPVMLKFKDDENVVEPIRQKGKIKLVTPCKPMPTYRNYILKEYLAYKLYNQVTPYSFRTRLVKITYIDIFGSRKPDTVYGFLIENEESLAGRNNTVVGKKVNALEMIYRNPTEVTRVAVFNYMIGNTDWSVLSQHNVKILTSPDKSSYKAIPVIYDFDYSGLVNTDYSIPHEGLPIESVRDRYYQGVCLNEEEMKPILEEYRELKDQLLGTIRDFEYLSNGYKKQMETYINSFYKAYDHGNFLIDDMNRTCRNY